MSRTPSTNGRGITPLFIVLIIVGILAAAAGGWFAVSKLGKGKASTADQTAKSGEETATASPTTVDELTVDALGLNLQTSSLPSLDASAVNMPSQNISSGASSFPNLSLDTSIDYDIDLDYDMPTVSDDDIKPKTLAQPSGGTGTSGGSTGQTGTTPSASSCAQFSGIPSCSYVSDSTGRALCESCKSAGY
jgi:hypothetical protein